jgi:hypothetical protein
MTSLLATRPARLAKFAAVPLLAVLIGVAVAIGSSPASVTSNHPVLGTPSAVPATPSPAISPSPPTVTASGLLGKAAQLVSAGPASVAAAGTNIAAASTDGGKTWTTVRPPAKAAGIAIDPTNPLRAVTGGSFIQATVDGGAKWTPVQTLPPGNGQYRPLLISPFDGSVWFLVHSGKLLRTRDGSLTWRDLGGLPTLAAPVLTAGSVFGQFYLASGNSVFELIDNGQQIVAQPSLPAGVAVAQLATVGSGASTLFARRSGIAFTCSTARPGRL